jgi:hypothetical protein
MVWSSSYPQALSVPMDTALADCDVRAQRYVDTGIKWRGHSDDTRCGRGEVQRICA